MHFSPPSSTLRCALAAALLFPNACKHSDCNDSTEGNFAVEFVFFDEDEDCDYSGKVVRKEESGDVEQVLECGIERNYCTCRGGDEFGTYEVYLENDKTGEVQYAEYEVEPNATTCVMRSTDGFTVLGEGGAGGSH